MQSFGGRGQNQNWPLADFEVNEIKESLEEIQKYCSDRPEVKAIGMIGPVIDSVNHSIQQKGRSVIQEKFRSLNEYLQ